MTGCHLIPAGFDTSSRVQPLDLADLLAQR